MFSPSHSLFSPSLVLPIILWQDFADCDEVTRAERRAERLEERKAERKEKRLEEIAKLARKEMAAMGPPGYHRRQSHQHSSLSLSRRASAQVAPSSKVFTNVAGGSSSSSPKVSPNSSPSRRAHTHGLHTSASVLHTPFVIAVSAQRPRSFIAVLTGHVARYAV
jgi:hypothetical protein